MSEAYQYKVSAIVSTYNSEKFIQGCLDDLFDQSLYKQGQLEIVIVDSGSQQGEWELIQGMSQRPEFEHMLAIRTEERETLYAAWNRAIKLSRGKYIINANTDDRHMFYALEELADTLNNKPEAALVYGNCYYSTVANETYEQNDGTRLFRPPTYFAPALLLYYPFGPQPMWRKSVHDEIGLFDETYKAVGDWDFAIRLGQRYRALHVDKYLGLHYVGDGTISNRPGLKERENTRVRNKYQNLYTIETLYRREGVLSEYRHQKALMLSDLHKRANKFVCPNGGIAYDGCLMIKCDGLALNLPGAGSENTHNGTSLAGLPSQRELSLWEEISP